MKLIQWVKITLLFLHVTSKLKLKLSFIFNIYLCKLIKLLIITFLILFTCFRDFLYVNVEGTRKSPEGLSKPDTLIFQDIMI